MKVRFVSFSVIIFSVLLFSGCGIQSTPSGGVFRSDDGGKNFIQRSTVDEKNSLAGADILELAMNPSNPDTLYAGTTNRGIFKTTNRGDNWLTDQNNFRSVTAIEVNPQNHQQIIITAQVSGRGKVLKTENGGQKWEEIFTGRLDASRTWSLAMDYQNPNVLYVGDSIGGIYKSEDSGHSWRNLTWAKSGIRKIELDRINPKKIYFVTDTTGVFRTDNGGETFSPVEENDQISVLTPHPNREGVLYTIGKNGLQISNDSGNTFRLIETLVKMENLDARALAIDPTSDQIIYFASNGTLYKTENGGWTWKTIPLDLEKAITAILINPQNTQLLYLGTTRRSTSNLKLLPF